nr:MAG TPA: hypothetical protein [Caudoviricetes sp.]
MTRYQRLSVKFSCLSLHMLISLTRSRSLATSGSARH